MFFVRGMRLFIADEEVLGGGLEQGELGRVVVLCPHLKGEQENLLFLPLVRLFQTAVPENGDSRKKRIMYFR
jgi:hypothetical protein